MNAPARIRTQGLTGFAPASSPLASPPPKLHLHPHPHPHHGRHGKQKSTASNISLPPSLSLLFFLFFIHMRPPDPEIDQIQKREREKKYGTYTQQQPYPYPYRNYLNTYIPHSVSQRHIASPQQQPKAGIKRPSLTNSPHMPSGQKNKESRDSMLMCFTPSCNRLVTGSPATKHLSIIHCF